MESSRIARLLQPFSGAELTAEMLQQFGTYLELLARWNARMNLTAIRDPEQIVTRHFGESLFAARQLLDSASPPITITDIGSGAGFPGLPIKLWAPQNRLTLIESQNKKATFLREAVRSLQLDGVEVFCGRAEQWNLTADLVTLRAVEKFETVLPIAASRVRPGGRLGLLIGSAQVSKARQELSSWRWLEPASVPQSRDRVVAVALKAA